MQSCSVDKEVVSVEKLWAFLMPGALAEKCVEIAALREAGDTSFFKSEIQWRITLPEKKEVLKGRSESLNDACIDIHGCLSTLSGAHDGDAVVVCSLENPA